MQLTKRLLERTLTLLFRVPRFQFLGVTLVALGLLMSNSCPAQTPTPLILHMTATDSHNGDIPTPPPTVSTDESHFQYKDIQLLEQQGDYKAALVKADAAVAADPRNIAPYLLRSHIYSEMSQWDKADKDYQTILQLDPGNFPAQFNRSEVKLMKKDYDGARSGFFALEGNSDWGDLASYKVFACDLFAGHDAAAQGEFDAFNKVGSHASYYYANATWSFYHKHPEDGQAWVDSARKIYPNKINHFYSSVLVSYGYLPSPPPEDVKVP